MLLVPPATKSLAASTMAMHDPTLDRVIKSENVKTGCQILPRFIYVLYLGPGRVANWTKLMPPSVDWRAVRWAKGAPKAGLGIACVGTSRN